MAHDFAAGSTTGTVVATHLGVTGFACSKVARQVVFPIAALVACTSTVIASKLARVISQR